MPDWISELGSLASIASLLLTVWVLVTVRRLRSYYMFKARVPDLLNKLSDHSSNVSSYLNDFQGNKPQIVEELTRTEVVVGSLKKKLPQRQKGVKSLLKVLRDVKKRGDTTEKEVRRIYLDLVHIADQVNELQEDLEWRS